jgi:hypothetical protein
MPALMSRAPADRARVAVAAAFLLDGAAFGSWVSRVPAVRDGLDLSPAQLGLLLLCPGVGSMVGLPGWPWPWPARPPGWPPAGRRWPRPGWSCTASGSVAGTSA